MVPGAAVSPGTSNCSLANAAALIAIDELVFAAFVPSLTSVAVTVRVPELFKVTANVCEPATSAELDGRVALGSEDVIPTVSVTLEITFQFASTALTTTLNGEAAACALGVPVFPVEVPGAAISPGARIWSLAKDPGLTGIAGVVLPVMAAWLTSAAVTVALPAVLRATLRLLVPLTRAALAGKTALASLEESATV